MNEFYKMVSEDYPNQAVRVRPFQEGDEFCIMHTNEVLALGQPYKSHDNLMVKEIIYKPKRWWQLWKKREIVGYVIRCVRS